MLQEGALFTLTAVLYMPRATSPSSVGRHLFPAFACYEQSRSDALERVSEGSTPFLCLGMRELAGAQEPRVTSSQTDLPSNLGESLLLPRLVSH